MEIPNIAAARGFSSHFLSLSLALAHIDTFDGVVAQVIAITIAHTQRITAREKEHHMLDHDFE